MHCEAIAQLHVCLQKRESILGPLFKMLEASFELFVPLVVASMVDVVLQTEAVSYVWCVWEVFFCFLQSLD